jgi:hypothetical protein
VQILASYVAFESHRPLYFALITVDVMAGSVVYLSEAIVLASEPANSICLEITSYVSL